MDGMGFTIGDLARASGVGVETVRYYERRGLVAQPGRAAGVYRRYGYGHVSRIRFIRRAQELGFSLDEIGTLLELQDGTDRRSIRRIAAKRLDETRRRIADLQRIERVLQHLLHECEGHGKAPRCPIIAAIAEGPRWRSSLRAPRARASRTPHGQHQVADRRVNRPHHE